MSIQGHISLPLSSDDTLLNLFQCYLDMFDGVPPISERKDVFNEDSGFLFDLFTQTNKYLGEDLYTLSSVSDITEVSTITRELLAGQNIFNPFGDIHNNISLNLHLSSSDLINSNAKAGTNLENSDVIWQFVDGTVEGAWLKSSTEEFLADTACFKIDRGVNEFRFPYPDRGLSGEGLEWTGKGINNCNTTPYQNQDQQAIADLVEDIYWADTSDNIRSSSIALNKTTLVDNGAVASRDINVADTILVKPTRETEGGDFAWLFSFDRTELPITCGVNYMYYPLFRYTDPDREFTFNISPDQVESKSLSSIDILRDMCGSIAGINPDVSDQILKQSGRCETPTEGAWLSGGDVGILGGSQELMFDCKHITDSLTDSDINFELKIFEGGQLDGETCVEVWWGGGRLNDTININYNGKRYAVNNLDFIPFGTSPDPFSSNVPPKVFREVISTINGLEINGDPLVVKDSQFAFLNPYMTTVVGSVDGNINNIDPVTTDCSNLTDIGSQMFLQSFYLSGDTTISSTELLATFDFLSASDDFNLSIQDCKVTLEYSVDEGGAFETGVLEWDVVTDGISSMTLEGINGASDYDVNLTPHKPSFVEYGKTIEGAARQTGLHMVARPSESSHFFWEFPDMDATLVINGYEHDEYCDYTRLNDYTSVINPQIGDELSQWKHCNCKAVYHSPIGHNLDYDSYKEHIDIIYLDSGIEPFSLATWEDEEGNDYRTSDQFAVFRYTGVEPDAGYGVGIWETLQGEPLILQKGKSYVYKRASFGGCEDDTAPPFVVNSCACYDRCNENLHLPKWIKMVLNDNGEWVSTGEVTDMTLDAGSFYQYLKQGKIEYSTTKNNLQFDRITETPSFSFNTKFNNSKPYWAVSGNVKGFNFGIQPIEVDDYLITTQPEPSEIVLHDDLYVKYTRGSCDGFEWYQPMDFTVDLQIPAQWNKINFDTTSPELLRKIVGCGTCELVFPDSPNSCALRESNCDSFFTFLEASNEPSDMVLRTPINCDDTTEFFYFANNTISWEQEFEVVSIAGTSSNTFMEYMDASKPWNNLLNTHEALVKIHEKDDELKSKYEIGIFKPENMGVSKLECFGKTNEL